jgi:hypothetical protein
MILNTSSKKDKITIDMNAVATQSLSSHAQLAEVVISSTKSGQGRTLNISKILANTFGTAPLKSINELTEDEFWSICLGMHIPEGPYYPLPENMIEHNRDPFFIAKSIVDILLETEKENGMKTGASAVLACFHPQIFAKLRIPWCLYKVNRSQSSLYQKPDFLRIDWYCPWTSCNVTKRWYLVDCDALKNKHIRMSGKGLTRIKNRMLKQLQSSNCPDENVGVIEIMDNERSHKHVKGMPGGQRIHIEDALKELDELKPLLLNKLKNTTGPLVKLFSNSIKPLVQMAQNLINQPAEAFLGGFTSVTAHKLACYQQDNTAIKKQILKEFNFQKDDKTEVKLLKMMNRWTEIQTEKRVHMKYILHLKFL